MKLDEREALFKGPHGGHDMFRERCDLDDYTEMGDGGATASAKPEHSYRGVGTEPCTIGSDRNAGNVFPSSGQRERGCGGGG